ncbi:hypothetical protein Taro_047943 [Colocasia esculenta]|uniref:Uncharacterized protein n=1 Tax=Colocasia esculenta TaxID=4460 RepID=A0A843X1T6_COLES|nr:hypothetical protein [Colocasia esculenta]
MFLCVYTDCGLVSLARLRPVRGRRTRIKYVIGLTGLAEAFRHKQQLTFSSLPEEELETPDATGPSLQRAFLPETLHTINADT